MTTTLTEKREMNPTNVNLPANTSHKKISMKVKKIIMNPTYEVFVIIIIIMMTKMKAKKTKTNPTSTKMTKNQIITNHTNVNAPVCKLMTLVK
jgi:hypothetical protein